MVDRQRKLVFVTGCQRSGTTLVGQILGAHPDAVLIDEGDGVYEWFAQAASAPSRDLPLPQQALLSASSKYRVPEQRFSRTSGGELQLAPHVSHLVLKVPNLTYAFSEIAALSAHVPVSVVSPIRDPRAVVVSMARLSRIPMVENQVRLIRFNPQLARELALDLGRLESPEIPPVLKRAIVWKIKNSLFTKFVQRGLNPYRLRYEDLVVDKAEYCRSLADHVGLNFHESVAAHEGEYVGYGPGKTDRTRSIDSSSKDSWTSELSTSLAAQVLSVAGELAAEFGYRQDDALATGTAHHSAGVA